MFSIDQCPRIQVARSAGLACQAGRLDGDGGPLAGLEVLHLPLDLHRLDGVGEQQAGLDGDGLEGAACVSAVSAVAFSVLNRDLFPQQPFDLVVQAGLVLLDDQDVVGGLPLDEEARVLALGVQGTGSTHPAAARPRSADRAALSRRP
ncbi:hypothetical protein AB0B45_46475 [Nonomuraea sp. NPDC049152]|uniref:hypothetical protein n=1 Tax=Nonomuraea sp. NPDC049152 TaxID=3154350 RepID=UPI0033E23FEE